MAAKRPLHVLLLSPLEAGGRYQPGAVVTGEAAALAVLIREKLARKARPHEIALAAAQVLMLPRPPLADAAVETPANPEN